MRIEIDVVEKDGKKFFSYQLPGEQAFLFKKLSPYELDRKSIDHQKGDGSVTKIYAAMHGTHAGSIAFYGNSAIFNQVSRLETLEPERLDAGDKLVINNPDFSPEAAMTMLMRTNDNLGNASKSTFGDQAIDRECYWQGVRTALGDESFDLHAKHYSAYFTKVDLCFDEQPNLTYAAFIQTMIRISIEQSKKAHLAPAAA